MEHKSKNRRMKKHRDKEVAVYLHLLKPIKLLVLDTVA